MNDQTNSLLQRYLDDRDGLGEDELEQLASALRDSPELRLRMRDQLVIDELVAQSVAVDRGNFPAQVNQRLRDEQDQGSLARQLHDMHELASAEWDRWSETRNRQRRGVRRRWVALSAFVLIAIVGGTLGFREYGPIASVQMVQGKLKVVRDGRQVEARPGMMLYDGDKLVTTGGRWSLEFADHSLLAVRGPSDMQLTGRRTQAKLITVVRGDLTANVQPQPVNAAMRLITSNAEAVVLGTELFLLVDQQRTRLDVAHGKVRLENTPAAKDTGTRDDESVIVETGGYAVAAAGRLVEGRRGWPMSSTDLLWSGEFDESARMLANYVEGPVAKPLTPRGEAAWRKGRLTLNGGAFQVSESLADDVLNRCQTANAVSIEMWIKQGLGMQPELARIVSFGTEKRANFSLTARADAISLRMASTLWEGGRERPIQICGGIGNRWRHLVVSYGVGRLACYLDGHLVKTWDWKGDLSPWESGYFMLGDDWEGDGQHAWAGDIGAMAVYSRELSAHEVYRNWRLLQDRL